MRRVAVVCTMALLAAACSNADVREKGKDQTLRPSAATQDWVDRDDWTLVNMLTPYESEHPYRNEVVGSWTFNEPSVSAMRIHFNRVDLETGYDFVRLFDGEGNLIVEYTGELGPFWSPEIPGGTMVLEFSSDYSVTSWGFSVDTYATLTEDREWKTQSVRWETNAAGTVYPNNLSVQTSVGAYAVKSRLHFPRFDTEAGYDSLKIYNGAGHRLAEYSGNLGELTTPTFRGSNFYLKFDSDYIVRAGGVELDQIEYVPARDLACPMIFAPVCGADGQTYGNACTAGLIEMPVVHSGECGTQVGDLCGGLFDNACGPGLLCNKDSQLDDASGTCDLCVCPQIFAPVCGTDGNTYSNGCHASCMQVEIAYDGECL